VIGERTVAVNRPPGSAQGLLGIVHDDVEGFRSGAGFASSSSIAHPDSGHS
jgi:hypothetical protein